MRKQPYSVIPGFGTTLSITSGYIAVMIVLPLAALLAAALSTGLEGFAQAATSPRALASYRLTFLTSLAAALANAVIGTLIAWVLVRYRFLGRSLLNALVDIPLALPTAVAGITYCTLYSRDGMLGSALAVAGIQVAYTQLGIIVMLTFIGLPFVVRTVQPVLEDMDRELEEAAAVLGAGGRTTFRRVVLPIIQPAVLTGFSLAFVRGIGEYGSVVFIAGNMPMQTEIAPLLIMTKLDQFDHRGAAALAVVVLSVSLVLQLAIGLLHKRVHT